VNVISPIAVAGVVIIAASVLFLGYILGMHSRHDEEMNAERVRAGLAPIEGPKGAPALVGAFLAAAGGGFAVGTILLAFSYVVYV
jgi:hypothetical protein